MKLRVKNDNILKDLKLELSEQSYGRFKSFCNNVLKTKADDLPSQQSIFMRQTLSIVFSATILFMLTNGFYLVKNIIFNTMLPIDMIPLYIMVASSLAMLIFLSLYKKYGTETARYVLLAYYVTIIVSVTIFMVSCNFHNIGLSISMCYLFVIMIAPTYKRSDTAILVALIFTSWWLPSVLPYAENYNLFKHFLLRFSIIIGFIVVRYVFLRQSYGERRIKEMSNEFLKLAYNDIVTGTLNRKAVDTYAKFIINHAPSKKVGVIIYDIDNFKSYNDNYSHLEGDEVLYRIAESVINVLEKSDLYLFRFGGEEFGVILPDTDEENVKKLAEELLEAVRAVAIPRSDLPNSNTVTASFGVACGSSDELNALLLVAKADKQLYISKTVGKNCVTFSDVTYM